MMANHLPTIDARTVMPSVQEAQRQIQIFASDVLAFEHKFRGRLAKLSHADLVKAFEEFAVIQTRAAEMQYIGDFYEEKFTPDNKGSSPYSRLLTQAGQPLGTFFDEVLLLKRSKLQAVAQDPAAKQFRLLIDRIIRPKYPTATDISERRIEKIEDRAKYHITQLRDDQPTAYLTAVLCGHVLSAARSGYENPADLSHYEAYLTKAEVDALQKSLQQNKPVLAEYARARSLLITPTDLASIPREMHPDQLTWEQSQQLALGSFDALSPQLGSIARSLFEEGRVDVVPNPRMNITVMASQTRPTAIFMGFIGSLFDTQELTHELGHGVHFMQRSSGGDLRVFHTPAIDEVLPDLMERVVWDQMAKLPVPNYDCVEKARDNLVSALITNGLVYEFHQAAFKLCSQRVPFTAVQLDKEWGRLQQEYYGVTATPEQSQMWKGINLVTTEPFNTLPYMYAQLVSEKMWLEHQADPVVFAEKLSTFLREGGAKTPRELLKRFGYNTEDANFWNSAFADVQTAVRDIRDRKPKGAEGSQPT